MNTEWRPVPGYPTYEINRDGQVRRCAEDERPPGEPLTPKPGRGGYPCVHLSLGEGRQKQLKLHRALLEAFVGPPPEPGMFALHADDDPANLDLNNLRWGTRHDNRDDARRNGRLARIAVWRKERSHCKNGHEYNDENTSARTTKEGYTFRNCLVCGREQQQRYRRRRVS